MPIGRPSKRPYWHRVPDPGIRGRSYQCRDSVESALVFGLKIKPIAEVLAIHVIERDPRLYREAIVAMDSLRGSVLVENFVVVVEST